MKPFELNAAGRIVFPSNFFPELDLTTITDVDHLDSVIRRDFDTKAPTVSEILSRAGTGTYPTKYELMRDIALNTFWSGRFVLTMFEMRPTRWGDVPRGRDDVYLPIVAPWPDHAEKYRDVENAFAALPASWDEAAENDIFDLLFDTFAKRTYYAGSLPTLKPTVSQLLRDPDNVTIGLTALDTSARHYTYDEVIDCSEEVPELEALHRWSMVLHNEQPWPRAHARTVRVGDLADDDYVVVLHPRNREVQRFVSRVAAGRRVPRVRHTTPTPVEPSSPYPRIDVGAEFEVAPKILAIGVAHGELTCSNDDIIRNSAYNWSPMSADRIAAKTGILERRYTAGSLEELGLAAARRAIEHAGIGPEDIGAIVACTCTSGRLIPSLSTWISGELGIAQVHAGYDLIAACAGLPYGLAEAVRILQQIRRPVLVVCVEKFSDKIGNVRTSRMIFGDGAGALIVGPAADGETPDIEYLQTYAGGPTAEVNSIIWPNPDFDNNITVFGPDVKSLAGRYLVQMLDDIRGIDSAYGDGSVLDTVDLIIPHQANKTMVTELAQEAGLTPDQLYFNIETVGNTSSASIPLAIHDAVRDGVITGPTRIFAPGFGAGAVAGYSVMTIDPSVVAVDPA